jgi:uncharacterized pyridoxal phosphate-dependent enzyme
MNNPTTTLHDKYGLTPVINAAGSYTPLGVSRSSAFVARQAAQALQAFFVIEELQQLASRQLAAFSGAQAGAVTHCASAAITQAVAACITGTDAAAVADLPDVADRRHTVVIPEGHCVDYGHPILTDIRLAGARALRAGDRSSLPLAELERCLDTPGVCGLLLVSSRLTAFQDFDWAGAVALARARRIPTVIDGAAQDLRVPELLRTGADAILVSAHKYLASPTAGLVLGTQAFIDAFRAQERGIGRAMKPSKEAVLGVLAALEERSQLDTAGWRARQDNKVALLMDLLHHRQDLDVRAEDDPAGMPFQRIRLAFRGGVAAARDVVGILASGRPSIRVMEHGLENALVHLELVALDESEVRHIAAQLAVALDARGAR